MSQISGEGDDPLKRIQEEINEVKRRELELRNHMRYESLKNPVSDIDSGISTTASSPVNGASTNTVIDSSEQQKSLPTTTAVKSVNLTTNYVRSTSAAAFVFAPRNPKPNKPIEFYQPVQTKYSRSKSEPKKEESNMLTRTMSTPQLFQALPQRKAMTKKGIMERFIATRGRLNQATPAVAKTSPIDNGPASSIFISPVAQPTPIERDQDGRPIRKGYVPVEEKIQKELREMKHREVELKLQRQKSYIYDSNHNLIDDDESKQDGPESLNSSDFDRSESSYKLSRAKSSNEIFDEDHQNGSLSPRNSPVMDRRQTIMAYAEERNRKVKLRPAVSLAQLCDMEEVETSSHSLIAMWECLIKKKKETKAF